MEPSQEQRRDFLRSVRDALQLLLLDAELLENGFVYFYVVDFAAIYGYVYKTPNAPFLPIPGEPDERTFARQQVALQTLFTKHGRPLLLIPPYAAELRNHVRSLTLNIELARLDASSLYKDKLERLIESSEHFANFVRIRSGRSGEAIDDQLRQEAVAIGREYFPELYAIRACISSQGPNAEELRTNAVHDLQRLFHESILRDSEEVIPQLHNIDYSSSSTENWFDRIKERRKKNRGFQSWTDAMACTYIEHANRLLNPEKKIVVFISPSSSVEATLKHQPLISLPAGSKVSVVRDLTYCLLASIHGSNNNAEDKALIRQSLSTVTSLLSVYESPIPVNWRDNAKEAALEWKKCENLLLMSESSQTKDRAASIATDLDVTFLFVLEQLYRAVGEDRATYAAEVEATLHQLHTDAVRLGKMIPGESTVNALRAMSVRTLSRSVRIVFPGLQDELPIAISFTDRNVVRLANGFQKLKSHNYSDASILTYRSYIVETASEPQSGPEHHLLAGYILALENKYDAALSELNAGREKADGEGNKELLFLSAVIHRKLYHAKEACGLLESALQLDRADPRLNLEYAKALWLRWREGVDDHAKNHGLKRALEHLKAASRAPKSSLSGGLRAQIANVTAFICTELSVKGGGHASDLDTARDRIREMAALLHESKWTGRFFDTRAYWSYAKAMTLSSTEHQEKQQLLESAAKDIAIALKSEEDIGARLGVRREHQSLINEALSAFL